jgi:alpha/beta superfamily hydrolase
VNEEAITFGRFASLVGILTPPAGRDSQGARTAVILLNAGIVHRVGAGRVHVKLARALASLGFLTLRFDFSGIGDSAVRDDNLNFDKSAVAETQDAMDFLERTKGIQQFILLGGCSGARIALAAASCDARVIGGLLINFPFDGEDDASPSPDAVHRGAFFYYRKSALFNLNSWGRLVTGQANYRKLARALWFAIRRGIAAEQEQTPRIAQFRLDIQHLADRRVHLTFICSEGDHRLDDLQVAGGAELKHLRADRKLSLEIIKRSDHTFSSLHDQEELTKAVLKSAPIMVRGNKQPSDCALIADASTILSHQLQS